MDLEKLKILVAEGLTIAKIHKLTSWSKTNIRYWINKCGLTLAHGPSGFKKANCSKCGTTLAGSFYGHKKSLCKKHYNDYRTNLALTKRIKIIELMGGKCVECGFNKYRCSLDVHHTNPATKDINFDKHRGWSLKRMTEEIKSCILLCKNCHAAYHGRELTLGLVVKSGSQELCKL